MIDDVYLQSKKDQYNQRYHLAQLLDQIRRAAPANVETLAFQIAEREINNAAKRAVDAGYSGSMGDDGAGAKAEALRNFLDGVVFALTGETIAYKDLVAQISKESDREYQEYLRLTEKFGE